MAKTLLHKIVMKSLTQLKQWTTMWQWQQKTAWSMHCDKIESTITTKIEILSIGIRRNRNAGERFKVHCNCNAGERIKRTRYTPWLHLTQDRYSRIIVQSMRSEIWEQWTWKFVPLQGNHVTIQRKHKSLLSSFVIDQVCYRSIVQDLWVHGLYVTKLMVYEVKTINNKVSFGTTVKVPLDTEDNVATPLLPIASEKSSMMKISIMLLSIFYQKKPKKKIGDNRSERIRNKI